MNGFEQDPNGVPSTFHSAQPYHEDDSRLEGPAEGTYLEDQGWVDQWHAHNPEDTQDLSLDEFSLGLANTKETIAYLIEQKGSSSIGATLRHIERFELAKADDTNGEADLADAKTAYDFFARYNQDLIDKAIVQKNAQAERSRARFLNALSEAPRAIEEKDEVALAAAVEALENTNPIDVEAVRAQIRANETDN